MLAEFFQLIVLFVVIIDPFLSFAVFFVATSKYDKMKRLKIATLAIFLAAGISLLFIIFGENVLKLFSTDINSFRVAGGIVLGLLGLDMVWGKTASHIDSEDGDSTKAIATIIATPLLTGPACIMAIILSTHDYGRLVTGAAVFTVLAFTGLLLCLSVVFKKFIGKTFVKILTTLLGLITLAWAIEFIRIGLGF